MKLKVVDTPENIALFAEALRQSPLIASVSVGESKKWAAHNRTAIAWLHIAFNDTEVNSVSDTLIVPPSAIIKPRATIADQIDRTGWVYLLQLDSGHYKIGRTTNPKSRIKTFGSKLPSAMIKYAHLIQTDDSYTLESKLHREFDARRSLDSREYFLLSEKDVRWIKSIPEVCNVADVQWSTRSA